MMSEGPRSRRNDTGQVVAFNNHGEIVYGTRAEHDWLVWGQIVVFISFPACVVVFFIRRRRGR
jgi:hypothetical protein